MKRRLALVAMAAVACLGVAGCPQTVEKQLEAVARKWSAMIRASQIIAVYPLTEDLQPGDIFLVQTPIDQQQKMYRKQGYLPLDNHLGRLDPMGYKDFYDHSFDIPKRSGLLPKDFLAPGGDRKGAWTTAPEASFPTYSFEFKSDKGLDLAVPLQGVPVGLSLLQSQHVIGSVNIRQVRTLGVDMVSLYKDLTAWVGDVDRLRLLQQYRPDEKRPSHRNFLRVVSRIFLVGEVDISMSDARSGGAGVDVSTPRPVELLFTKAGKGDKEIDFEAYKKNLDLLNSALKEDSSKGTGGSVRVTAASLATIGLKETFDPPLVIGYLGFDCEIFDEGLGPPIPTHARIVESADGGESTAIKPDEKEFAEICDRRAGAGDHGKEFFEAAAENLGSDWVTLYKALLKSQAGEPQGAFQDLARMYWTDTGTKGTVLLRQKEVFSAVKLADSKFPKKGR